MAAATLVDAVGTGRPLYSMLSHAIPALLIQSSNVLCDSARDAVMLTTRVVPLAWWARERKGPKIMTCVK